MNKITPVRLCCGTVHSGSICPDNKVMCILCFEHYPIEQLNKVNGKPEDVCINCAKHERR